jgi:hypothetical protein
MERDDVLLIDCDDCCMAGTSACTDCVVTFLCGRDETGVVVIDAAEVRALRLLRDAGLAPDLRHRPRDERSGPHRMVRSG